MAKKHESKKAEKKNHEMEHDLPLEQEGAEAAAPSTEDPAEGSSPASDEASSPELSESEKEEQDRKSAHAEKKAKRLTEVEKKALAKKVAKSELLAKRIAARDAERERLNERVEGKFLATSNVTFDGKLYRAGSKLDSATVAMIEKGLVAEDDAKE